MATVIATNWPRLRRAAATAPGRASAIAAPAPGTHGGTVPSTAASGRRRASPLSPIPTIPAEGVAVAVAVVRVTSATMAVATV